MSDPTALLAQARAGDESAWSALLEAQRPYLTQLARAQIGPKLRGKTDAADIVQDTFLEAHRDLPGFRGTTDAEFLAWLRQVLARNLTNLLRRYYGTQARDPRRERPLADGLDRSSQAADPALVASQSTPSQQAARRELSARTADALQALPADYRDVLVLRYLEGLSFPDVAARMGRSLDSVEKLWVRALARLRRTLGDDA
jgi:RNA polymerase sigma-70 factor (ECF subfamily)